MAGTCIITVSVFHAKKWHTKQKSAGIIPVLFAGDPYGTRTHVTTVKGWCLNRLTNGPYGVRFSAQL